jgi:hypothetical protein
MRQLFAVCWVAIAGCGADDFRDAGLPRPRPDGGGLTDAGSRAEPDAGAFDAGVSDDAGTSAVFDAGGSVDAGLIGIDAGDSLDSGRPFDAGVGDAGRVDAGSRDAGLLDAGQRFDGGCQAILCDTFEGYTVGGLSNSTTLGPWRVSAPGNGGSAAVDRTRAFSGTSSFKVHIDANASSGGQLRMQRGPVFASARNQLFGRFMLYLEPNSGTSNHWTMFGAAGVVPPGTAAAGNRVTYLYSAFNDANNNRFGAVYYNNQTRQDCWHHSTVRIPTGRWACISFAVDGNARTYRMGLDGQPAPSMSINGVGDGCVAHPGNSPWIGPLFDEFYVGALSFHAMTRPLDLWIDDVVLDTSPVNCP